MKRIKLPYFPLIILVSVWLSSCNPNQAVSLSLPDFSGAYSITIIDKWDAPVPVAPINSLYVLESSLEHFEGAALFSVGYFADTQEETTPISIPKDIIRSFLQKLSQAHPENGEYKPFVEWTDDYPEIAIRVLYGNAETIEFYTTSQGDEHVPWKVTYNIKSYIVNSGIPMQALEILRPYLAQDVLENLMKKVE